MGDRQSNKEIGNEGEDRACSFLKGNGFEIIRRNYRCHQIGEIDIIAKKNKLVIFVEVKSRNYNLYGGACYSISNRKKKTLKITAEHYLASNPAFFSMDETFRFDLISIYKGKIDWLEDIIR